MTLEKIQIHSTGSSVPREVIHLLEIAKENQIKKLERGGEEPPQQQLFDRSAFKDALPSVSKVRFEQTLLAEYPNMRNYLMKLNGEKAEQSLETLAQLWSTENDETRRIAQQLSEIGFFDARGTREAPSYWVPFLYRNALDLVQGKAEII